MLRVIALHGFSLNGARMRAQLGGLEAALAGQAELVFPDGPHGVSAASVERLHAFLGMTAAGGPHLAWWDAVDDGRVYQGWEESRDRVAALMKDAPGPVGLLGFSQGAIFAAALAALADPAPAFVVLVAGRTPRAADLASLFAGSPLEIPSLHVWGERDGLTAAPAAELVERFAPATREVAVWPGGHVIPTRGPAYAAIVDFVGRRVGGNDSAIAPD